MAAFVNIVDLATGWYTAYILRQAQAPMLYGLAVEEYAVAVKGWNVVPAVTHARYVIIVALNEAAGNALRDLIAPQAPPHAQWALVLPGQIEDLGQLANQQVEGLQG